MAAKHVLAGVCEVERRSDVFHINPIHINIVDGWNARTDFSGEDELVESIKEEGVLEPLYVRKTATNTLDLVSGERRLRATLRAISEGSEIKSVPVIVTKKGTNQQDLFIRDLNSNGGRPLGAVEEAGAFKRLLIWGFSAQEIATRTGRSLSHVKNRIDLSNASRALKESLNSGETTITEAQAISRESGGDIEEQEKALEKKKSEPKRRNVVFKSDSKEKKLECPAITDLFLSENFKEELESSGYDISTLKITIAPLEAE